MSHLFAAGQTWLSIPQANKWSTIQTSVIHLFGFLRPVFHFGLPPIK